MKTTRWLFAASAILILSVAAFSGEAEDALEKMGVERGICAILGEGGCELAIAVANKSELLIYVQVEGSAAVASARKSADAAGLLGTRIFVEGGKGGEVHLCDNIVDAVVVLGDGFSVSEALRVVHPTGKAVVGGKVVVKEFPAGVDDWSHPYHGPDNNPQSEDLVARAPYLTQFLAEPRYAPVPQVAVASAGRVFKAFGSIAFKEREEPYLNKLVAFNGYNGTELWQRELSDGLMIHRNTLIATPDRVYVGDDKSCKVIESSTGRLVDEIIPPVSAAGGTFWKWMALEDGVLYALMGAQEQNDGTQRWKRETHGWPWAPISKGFNQENQPWGYGRHVLAINPASKEVLWSHAEREAVDGRAICMKKGRIYIFRFGSYLACLDAKDGSDIWRKTPENSPELFDSLGEYLGRQDWRTNWRTTCYLKCSEKALYFAGPQVGKLLAVSAEDGRILWENGYSNYQLVLRGDVMYGLSGQIDKHPSTKFSAMTGEVLAEIGQSRRACTRPTGSVDAIFFRASGGSVRLDTASNRPEWISPMRPPCHDGVTIANGLLYWWPSVCDCQLTIYGITCLGPAGDFDFNSEARREERFERGEGRLRRVAGMDESAADWRSFRADSGCSSTSGAAIADRGEVLWRHEGGRKRSVAAPASTAPVAAGGLVFVGSPEGVVRALDSASGEERWKAYTGGAIRVSPTVWKGRVYVGSGDGWVYSFEGVSGRLLWRFRAAPAERMIPVYGLLMSRWPAASGVVVEDGIAYVSAGIVNYDGTYVYALDAVTGEVKWQNVTSGHLYSAARTGVSVQGHQLLHGGRLYLAGGTSISPAVYDASDGRCMNDAGPLASCNSTNPRGCELYLLGDQVVACGRPFYADPRYGVYDATVFNRVFIGSSGGRDVAWVRNQGAGMLLCFEEIDEEQLNKSLSNGGNRFNVEWRKLGIREKPVWSYECKESVGVAVCRNAVVVGEGSRVTAVDTGSGKVLWSADVGGSIVEWGIAVDRAGRVLVTLSDGDVVCVGSEGRV